jgi:hypothetical protein
MLSLKSRPVQSPARITEPDPFIFSVDLVQQLQLMEFARRVLAAAAHLMQPKRLPSVGGHPDTYSEATILVTIMVMAIWRLSPRQMVNRLQRWPALAEACGYSSGQVISASQLYRRRLSGCTKDLFLAVNTMVATWAIKPKNARKIQKSAVSGTFLPF